MAEDRTGRRTSRSSSTTRSRRRSSAPARARRDARRSLDDEVFERPLRRGRRRGDDQRRRRSPRSFTSFRTRSAASRARSIAPGAARLKTLAVRMRQHVATATVLADWLASHAQVEKVFYPGLRTHKGHALAAKQMKGSGRDDHLRAPRAVSRRRRRFSKRSASSRAPRALAAWSRSPNTRRS